jgi:Tubulin-tyrosine ligase family
VCRYGVVERSARSLGWGATKDDGESWTVYWSDTTLLPDKLMRLRSYQRVNHYPGMNVFARKASMARTLNRVQALCPGDVEFVPRTWVLPEDWASFSAEFGGAGRTARRTFIVKPSIGSQGRGIFLTRTLDDVDATAAQVAQRYVARPLLLDGRKFDLRVYVLVLALQPMRIYMFDDGLVRLASLPYRAPAATLDKVSMHLTNYSLNKHHAGFEQNTGADKADRGNKRSIQWLLRHLAAEGRDVEALWAAVGDLVVRTLLAAQPFLLHTFSSGAGVGANPDVRDETRSCFEVLGFDVLLDENLKPWLMEVNHSPSFSCDSPLDESIKRAVVTESLALLGLKRSDRRRDSAAQSFRARSRLYDLPDAPISSSAAVSTTTTTTTTTTTPTTSTAASSSSTSTSSTSTSSLSKWERGKRAHERRTAEHFQRLHPLPGTEAEDGAVDLRRDFRRHLLPHAATYARLLGAAQRVQDESLRAVGGGAGMGRRRKAAIEHGARARAFSARGGGGSGAGAAGGDDEGAQLTASDDDAAEDEDEGGAGDHARHTRHDDEAENERRGLRRVQSLRVRRKSTRNLLPVAPSPIPTATSPSAILTMPSPSPRPLSDRSLSASASAAPPVPRPDTAPVAVALRLLPGLPATTASSSSAPQQPQPPPHPLPPRHRAALPVPAIRIAFPLALAPAALPGARTSPIAPSSARSAAEHRASPYTPAPPPLQPHLPSLSLARAVRRRTAQLLVKY